MGAVRLLRLVMVLIPGLTLAGMAASGTAQAAETGATVQASGMAKDYAEGGAKTCMKCHDEPPVTLILRRPHGMRGDARTPFSAQDCETCHGASPQHLETPEEGQKRRPVSVIFGRNSPTPVADQNAVCLTCHESGLRMNWQGSPHQFNDVPCAACHTIHTLHDKVLAKATQPEVCFDCHATQRAQAQRLSHHPVREGKMSCTDCHNPHGSAGEHQLKKNTVNQTCYQCHAEKRGPFLWEHPPVREDCTICHQPHGAAQPRMLKVRSPWLCQQCHSTQFHPSTAYSGTGIPAAGGATRQLLLQGCVNCHSQVHGSNHPSGVRFMR